MIVLLCNALEDALHSPCFLSCYAHQTDRQQHPLHRNTPLRVLDRVDAASSNTYALYVIRSSIVHAPAALYKRRADDARCQRMHAGAV